MSSDPSLRDLVSQAERLIAAENIEAATALVRDAYAKNKNNPDVLALVAQFSTDLIIRRNALTSALQGDPNHVKARALLKRLDTPSALSQAAPPPPSSTRPVPRPIPQPTTPSLERTTPKRAPASARSWLLLIPVAVVLGIVVTLMIAPRGGSSGSGSGGSGTPESVVVRFFEAQQRGDSATMLTLVTTNTRTALKTYDAQGGIAKVLAPVYPAGTVTNVHAMPPEPRGEGRVEVVLRLNGTVQGPSSELCQNNDLIRSGTTWELNKFDNFLKCNDLPIRATPAALQATSALVSSLEPTAQALAIPLAQTVAALTQTAIAGAPQSTQQALIAQQTLLAERLGPTQTIQVISDGLARSTEIASALSDTKVAIGKNARRITPDNESNAWPTWSPDGRSLLFSHYVEKTRDWQLVVLNLDTNTRTVMVDPSGFPRGQAAWVK